MAESPLAAASHATRRRPESRTVALFREVVLSRGVQTWDMASV